MCTADASKFILHASSPGGVRSTQSSQGVRSAQLFVTILMAATKRSGDCAGGASRWVPGGRSPPRE
eukprot:11316932-Alexandrium_andersonii.AAC.1